MPVQQQALRAPRAPGGCDKMAPKKKVAKTKVKKKKWMPVLAPKLFNNVVLGETHIQADEQVLQKSITLNLSTVMNDMRKQGYMVRFDVIKAHEGKALTALTGLTMTPSGMKRMIRRGRTKIEDSFLARLKTGQIVRVKPLIITINRCSKPARTSIRLAIREKVKQVLKDSTMESFVKEVLDNKLQRVLKDIAMKHHPSRSVDIRAIVMLPNGKADLATHADFEEKTPEKVEDSEKPVKKAKKKEIDMPADAEAETPAEKPTKKEPAEEKPKKTTKKTVNEEKDSPSEEKVPAQTDEEEPEKNPSP